MANGMGARFRELLARPQNLVIPGGFSPMMARMTEVLGFEAFFMAGSQTAAYAFGLPNLGLVSMREMVDNAGRVVAACGVPVFADAEAGFGSALNVHRTVQEFARAGVACICIEDQEDTRADPVEETIGKYRAAVAAREEIGSDMVICARCNFVRKEGGSFERALERCIRYAEVPGVDAVLLTSTSKTEQVREASQRIPKPAIFLSYGGPPNVPSLEEWQESGASATIFPVLTTLVGTQAIWDFLHDFKERGSAAYTERQQQGRESRWGAVNINSLMRLSPDKVKTNQELAQKGKGKLPPPTRVKDLPKYRLD